MIVIHYDLGLLRSGPRAYALAVNYRLRLATNPEQYAIGNHPPNYPVPALADTHMVLALGWVQRWIPVTSLDLAWDEIWRGNPNL